MAQGAFVDAFYRAHRRIGVPIISAKAPDVQELRNKKFARNDGANCLFAFLHRKTHTAPIRVPNDYGVGAS